MAKPLRVGLYILTALSAVAALFLEPALGGAVERGAISGLWLFTPLAFYVVFLLAYSVDRFILVKKRRYPAGKAFFQVAFGVVFALLLLPSTIGYWDGRPRGMIRLLSHADVEVRVVAVEAMGFRGFETGRAQMLVARLDDRDPKVREVALTVLAKWSGRKREDVAGIRAWASELSSKTSTTGEGG